MVSRPDPFVRHSPYEAMDLERRKRLVLGAMKRSLIYTIGLSPFFVSLLIFNYSIQMLIAISLLLGTVPIILIARKLAQDERPDAGSLILITYIIIMFFTNAQLVEGLQVWIAPGYVVLVILSGMILPPTRTFQIAAVVSILYLCSQILSNYDLPRYTLEGSHGDVVTSIVIALAFFVSAISIDMSTRDLRKALDDATRGLVRSNEELARASEMKSQFTARTSHELKTPLSSIIVFSDLALRGAYGPLNRKLKNALEFVVGSARKLKKIINNILDLSKIEAGELFLDDCPVNIREIVPEIVSVYQHAASKKNLSLALSIHDDVPAVIAGDEDRVAQILEILIENAVRFTEHGSVVVEISSIDQRHWQISVRDTGGGIPYDHLQNIFEPYYRLEPAPGALKSTGLGLAITKKLVDLMDGDIQIDSTLGRGTVALVTLPLVPLYDQGTRNLPGDES